MYLPGRANDTQKIRFLSGRGYLDIGLVAGSAHSLTDISGRPDWDIRFFLYDTQWKSSNLNLGVFTRYHFSQFLAFTLQLNMAGLSAADSLGYRDSRGLSFTNRIAECAILAEYYPIGIFHRFPLDVYGFLGIAAFYNNPEVWDHGVAVTHLDDFSNIQPAIPMGAGINYLPREIMKFGVSVGWRKLFTNYLDGLNTSANSKNDSYFFVNLKVSYAFDLR